ncbi:MAG TPA: nitronate monooxygenase [Bryobacteraceae bacterium]|nr:nitronate monooxygenase [Bryobacteraceae bacterium]
MPNNKTSAGRRRFVKSAAAAGVLGASGMAFAQRPGSSAPQGADPISAAIRTALTDLFQLQYPILLAPMGGAAGGELAAAVSNSGALGLVGGAYGNVNALKKELDLVKAKTQRKWGVGLITWRATEEALRVALSYRPDAFFLSFGDPLKFSKQIKAAGCVLICQIQDVASAIEAKKAGADLIVAQGTEAGGHGTTTRSTLPLVPAVIDAVNPTPVIGAGGIADGRGVAAALALGAAGAVIGTRFCATQESLLRPAAKERLLRSKSGDTIRTRLFDEVAGIDWPAQFNGRALKNRFEETWNGRAAEARNNPSIAEAYREAQRNGDYDSAVIWAGESLDLISGVPPAGELVRQIGADTVREIRRLAQLLT